MKKTIKVLVLIIWIGVSLFEILTYLFINPKPIYWRAWEVVSNYTGKDANFAPFKPRFVYDGTMTGDLLNILKFKPSKSEIRKQVFIVLLFILTLGYSLIRNSVPFIYFQF